MSDLNGDASPLLSPRKANRSLNPVRSRGNAGIRFIKKRYVVALFAFMGLAIVMALQVAVTQVAGKLKSRYNWTDSQKNAVTSSVHFGYILSPLIGGLLADYFGGKVIFGVGVFFCCVTAASTPLAAPHFYVLIALRVMAGFFEGLIYPAFNSKLALWAPTGERSVLSAIGYIGSFVGIIVSVLVSKSLNSESALDGYGSFLVFGCIAVIWILFYCLFAYGKPSKDPNECDAEEYYLQVKLHGHHDGEYQSFPWKHLLSSGPCYAILLAHLGYSWMLVTVADGFPQFSKNVFKRDLEEKHNIDEIVPNAAFILAAFISSLVADSLTRNKMLLKRVRQLFTSISFVTSSVFIILLADLSQHQRAKGLIYMSIVQGSLGLCYGGFLINHLDIGPRHAGALYGLTSAFSIISYFLVPIVMKVLVTCSICTDHENPCAHVEHPYFKGHTNQGCPPPTQGQCIVGPNAFNPDISQCSFHDVQREYRALFIVAASVCLAMGIAYNILASGHVQPWNTLHKPPVRGRLIHKANPEQWKSILNGEM
eukprot:m.57892 g.57892  ORF g.57892 m.57892 type:complete len:538 (+) comp11140_c0_seq2:208-1821(+)